MGGFLSLWRLAGIPAAAARCGQPTAENTGMKVLLDIRPGLMDLMSGVMGQMQPEMKLMQQFNAQFEHFQDDAPACDVCGSLTVRNGTCYKCFNCGNSMGCS